MSKNNQADSIGAFKCTNTLHKWPWISPTVSQLILLGTTRFEYLKITLCKAAFRYSEFFTLRGYFLCENVIYFYAFGALFYLL